MDRREDDRRTDTNGHDVGETIGEAAGGVSGVITGAAIGSLGGPLGVIIGGIAGAITGWWAGHTIAETARQYDSEHDPIYREQFERAGPADLSYDDVRPAYQIGYLAGCNPDWTGRPFEDVEPELRRGWETVATRLGPWERVREYARDAFVRARAGRPLVLEEQVSVPTPAANDVIATRSTDISTDLR